MREVVLFIAMSLDGYIADVDGNVDWLMGETTSQDDMQSYHRFIKEVDTVLMGWNTYHQVASELSPSEWYYKGLQSYVFTHRKQKDTEDIMFINEALTPFLQKLRQQEGKTIWICGGAQLIQQLVQDNLIDRYHISIIPTLLGDGIQLFQSVKNPISLHLIETTSYNGITDVVYGRKHNDTN